MNKDTLQHLLEKMRLGLLTAEEKKELESWEASLDDEEPLLNLYSDTEQEEIKQRMWERINGSTSETGKVILMPRDDSRSIINRIWKVAIIVIILAGSAWFLWRSPPEKPVIAEATPPESQRDIPPPSSNHATLILAGGQQIFLDGKQNGTIATEGNVSIKKMGDGRIVYTGNNEDKRPRYNTLTVPRGSQISSITLEDGTQVYLNAESSLTFPVTFVGNERRVRLKGEGYFEVAKNPSKKFIVQSEELTMEVLGTHFNVNNYPDETSKKVTLLEGSIKVSGGNASEVISPGSQAVLENGKMNVNPSVDLDQVMAWKNGVFNFNNADCGMVMRQLARWYDIDVVYPNGIPNIQFGGEIQKTLSLAEMLEALGAVDVKFRISNRKLIVLP